MPTHKTTKGNVPGSKSTEKSMPKAEPAPSKGHGKADTSGSKKGRA